MNGFGFGVFSMHDIGRHARTTTADTLLDWEKVSFGGHAHLYVLAKHHFELFVVDISSGR